MRIVQLLAYNGHLALYHNFFEDYRRLENFSF